MKKLIIALAGILVAVSAFGQESGTGATCTPCTCKEDAKVLKPLTTTITGIEIRGMGHVHKVLEKVKDPHLPIGNIDDDAGSGKQLKDVGRTAIDPDLTDLTNDAINGRADTFAVDVSVTEIVTGLIKTKYGVEIQLTITTNTMTNWVNFREDYDITPFDRRIETFDTMHQAGFVRTNIVAELVHEGFTNRIVLKTTGKDVTPSVNRVLTFPAKYRPSP